jgi:hypothetical protein
MFGLQSYSSSLPRAVASTSPISFRAVLISAHLLVTPTCPPYLASGEVDDKIVEAKRKAKEAGAEVEEYVPPPLGTGLWNKPAPAAVPGSPPGQTTPNGVAASAVAGTKSTMAHLSTMALAVINAASPPPSG